MKSIGREMEKIRKRERELGGAHRKTWPVQPLSTRRIDPPSDGEDFPKKKI
jgi:hypothetical protein